MITTAAQKIEQGIEISLPNRVPDNSNKLHGAISKIVLTIGIPANLRGYLFIREAIMQTVGNPDMINNITKQLYPQIANKHNTTPSKVERAIRHAIEVGWSRGRIDQLNNMFGTMVYGKYDRPTNGEFIALLADKMLVDGFTL
jgi:two-component system response regulator (stage 0 sporulation protein A)